VIISIIYLLPAVVQTPQNGKVIGDLIKITCFLLGLRLAALMFSILTMLFLFLIDPESLASMLTQTVGVVARYTGPIDPNLFGDLGQFLIQALMINLLEVFLIFVLLLASLVGVLFLLREIFTWYSLSGAENRLIKVAYLTIAWVALVMGLLVLPTVTLLFLKQEVLFSSSHLLMSFAGLAAAVAGTAAALCVKRGRLKACPCCHQPVPGVFHAGGTCENCHTLLHPWLFLEYTL
jgi:hypothetical protein